MMSPPHSRIRAMLNLKKKKLAYQQSGCLPLSILPHQTEINHSLKNWTSKLETVTAMMTVVVNWNHHHHLQKRTMLAQTPQKQNRIHNWWVYIVYGSVVFTQVLNP